jgi:predicted GH43/DUF377 family glycosyl hydrolase
MKTSEEFFGNGFFDWQLSGGEYEEKRKEWKYNEEKYWGGFSREPLDMAKYEPPYWAIGHFKKHGKPVLSPTEGKWDCGSICGGVHNGSILWRNGQFYYIYRGESPIPGHERANPNIGYICDIGVAVSEDGVNFEKRYDVSPFFRKDGDACYSFEDVNIAEHEGRYYMFVNRWDWAKFDDPSVSGAYMAYSDDLLHWTKCGLVYPNAKRIHRNCVVVQNANNEAVRINGKFVMYINDGLIGYSDDMIHWESEETKNLWPGGEGCFALADYDKSHPDNMILFTGGHHTGHFYAVGEVLFSKSDVTQPLEWLPRPVLTPEIVTRTVPPTVSPAARALSTSALCSASLSAPPIERTRLSNLIPSAPKN